jgi:hypothetical protein
MNVDGVDSDSEIDEAMTDTPPDIADEASAAKQDLLPKKSGDLYNIENVDHKVEDLYFFVVRAVAKKKINVHLVQKMNFVLACFQVSAPPRLENPDSDKKHALFGLDTQITISLSYLVPVDNSLPY